MDHTHFDAITRSFGTASRRNLGRGLVGGGLGALLGSAFGALDVDAKKKRHKKKRKKRKHTQQNLPVSTVPPGVPPLVFNQYGCIEVGQPCRGDSSLCCSGMSQGAVPAAGQPDSSRCLAHDTGTCEQDAESICTTPDLALTTCNNRSDCGCVRTTSGSNYCAELFGGPGTSQCVSCERDADCIAAGLPATSACAPVSAGRCAGICATGMACLVPCGPKTPGM